MNTGDAPELVAPSRVRTRRTGKWVRVVGNLLIVAGLLMLLGVGGWYGLTQWQNQQFKDELASKFGPQAVDPPASTAQATPVVAAPPLPTLNGIGTGAGAGSLKPAALDDSVPVKLEIPSVHIDSKIVPIDWAMIPSPSGMKSEWQVADYAVGHHAGSANPGQVGNVVLSGHVDYKGQVFKDLDKVNKGDEVVVDTQQGQYIYTVTNMVLVKEDGVSDEQKRRNAAYMDPTPDRTLTMITCWPYGIDDHRLIVIAKPYQSNLSAQSEFSLR